MPQKLFVSTHYFLQPKTDTQRWIFNSKLLHTASCALSLPTSAGKTTLAEEAIVQTIKHGGTVIYLSPTRALAQERAGWQEKLEKYMPGIKVGVFDGDHASTKELNLKNTHLKILTPERLDLAIRNRQTSWLDSVKLCVIDEADLIGDGIRGARLEGTIIRLRMRMPQMRFLLLSGTFGNSEEICNWLGLGLVDSSVRPVSQTWEIGWVKKEYEKVQLLMQIVRQTIALNKQAIIFCSSKKQADELARTIRKCKINCESHHAGLTHEKRKRIEDAFNQSQLSVITATPTLAYGVNMPAWRVVIYDLEFYDKSAGGKQPIPNKRLLQMAGRAGRLGIDDQGSVVLLAHHNQKWATQYLPGNCEIEPTLSQLAYAECCEEQVIIQIANGCNRKSQLKRFFERSLAAYQDRLPDIDYVLDRVVKSGMATVEIDGEDAIYKVTKESDLFGRHFTSVAEITHLKRAILNPSLNCYRYTLLDWLIIITSSSDFYTLYTNKSKLQALQNFINYQPSWLLRYPESFQHICPDDQIGVVYSAALMYTSFLLNGTQGAADYLGHDYLEEVNQLVRQAVRKIDLILETIKSIDLPAPPQDHNQGVGVIEKLTGLKFFLKQSLPPTTLLMAKLEGISVAAIRQLMEQGISDLEGIVTTPADQISEITSTPVSQVYSWQEVAQKYIEQFGSFRYVETPPLIASLQLLPPHTPLERQWQKYYWMSVGRTVKPISADKFEVTCRSVVQTVEVDHPHYSCTCHEFKYAKSCPDIMRVWFTLNPSLEHQIKVESVLNLQEILKRR